MTFGRICFWICQANRLLIYINALGSMSVSLCALPRTRYYKKTESIRSKQLESLIKTTETSTPMLRQVLSQQKTIPTLPVLRNSLRTSYRMATTFFCSCPFTPDNISAAALKLSGAKWEYRSVMLIVHVPTIFVPSAMELQPAPTNLRRYAVVYGTSPFAVYPLFLC